MPGELSGHVWERTGHDEMSWTSFYTLFLISTFIGLSVTAGTCYTFFDLNINPWISLIIGLVGGFGGIIIASKSDKAGISFFGLMLLASSFGIMLTTTMNFYIGHAETNDYNFAQLLIETGILTGAATVIMGTLGYVFSDFFVKLGGILFGALSGLLVLMIGQIILGLFGYPFEGMWITWLSVVIFCGYIGYDIGKVKLMPKTADNAVDAALALYLDIINLFLDFLRILAKSKEK